MSNSQHFRSIISIIHYDYIKKYVTQVTILVSVLKHQSP